MAVPLLWYHVTEYREAVLPELSRLQLKPASPYSVAFPVQLTLETWTRLPRRQSGEQLEKSKTFGLVTPEPYPFHWEISLIWDSPDMRTLIMNVFL